MDERTNTPIRIFLSSPSDVAEERDATVEILKEIEIESDGRTKFTLVRWEDRHYSAVKGFQEQIPSSAECDLLISIFWSRLGVELPPIVERKNEVIQFAREDGTARTGSEYEFETAFEAARKAEDDSGKAVPDIFVYRRASQPPLVEPHDIERQKMELRAVDGFFERWFRSERGHFLAAYHTYDSAENYGLTLRRHLQSWLKQREGEGWDVAVRGSPFRGLNAYESQHEAIFFGRDRAIRAARAKLQASAVKDGTKSLIVIGASGSGKSSMVRAGLLPRLMRPGGLANVTAVRTLIFKPASLGPNVFTGLANLMLGRDESSGGGLRELRSTLYRDVEKLAAILESTADGAVIPFLQAQQSWAQSLKKAQKLKTTVIPGLVICVDQLEEAFARPDSEREALFRLLTALASTANIYVVATLRSDFYSQLLTSEGLRQIKDQGAVFDLATPTAAEIEEIVEGPAQLASLHYERDGKSSADLRDLLVQDAMSPGALPLLSFTLEQLFSRRSAAGMMRLRDYESLGGLHGAIGRRAEHTFSSLAQNEGLSEAELESILRRLLRRLVREGQQEQVSGQPARLDQFPRGSVERRLVDSFVEDRLLMLEAGSALAV